MDSIGAPEIILIIVIMLILFGPGRIGKIAGELGSGIRAFRDGLSDKENNQNDIDSKAVLDEVPKEGSSPATVAEEEEKEVEVISDKGRNSHAK